ncbi:MAG: DUF1722 domain-containing protein, partial [Clostridiaceae bacterium]
RLDGDIRRRLVLENDGSVYTVSEVLALCQELGTPAVYDNLHNALHPAGPSLPDAHWIGLCAQTWKTADGAQKIHYSQPHPVKPRGAHSDFIAIDPFLDFYHSLPAYELAIMLEVKDKNLSALKCILCSSPCSFSALEAEWARYKYSVLEKSPSAYQEIRELFKNKRADSALAFYRLVEDALSLCEDKGRAENALEHVWGYFSNLATAAEQARYRKKLSCYLDGACSLAQVKSTLRTLAEKYRISYLLGSYYFTL